MRTIHAMLFTVSALLAAETHAHPVVIAASIAAAEPSDPVEQYLAAMGRRDFKQAFALASKMDLGESKRSRSNVLAFQGAALFGLKRRDEAIKRFEEADELWSADPFATRLEFFSSAATNNLDVARSALDRLIARYPDVVRELDFEMLRWFIREDSEAKTKEADDRLIALARIGYQGDNSHGDWLAYLAIKRLVKRGEGAEASDLLRYVSSPGAIQSLLIQKRYAALWTQAGERAGPGLEKIRNVALERAQKGYDQEPTSAKALSQLAFALDEAERFEDVVALRAKLPTSPEDVSKIDEDSAWVFDSVARALYETGHADEGDKLYGLLNEAPLLPDSWLVNMKINRIHYLVSDGKFHKALPLLATADKLPGSPYAIQLIRRMKYCTLNGVGRKEEAAKLLPDILKHAKDSYLTTIDALICAGQLDEAEKLALSALADEDFESDFVVQMQPVPLTHERPSIWTDGWAELRKRPALQREFEKLGRPMPKEFLTLAATPTS
jgi:tetratricopeptide (TPR) repeat protein